MPDQLQLFTMLHRSNPLRSTCSAAAVQPSAVAAAVQPSAAVQQVTCTTDPVTNEVASKCSQLDKSDTKKEHLPLAQRAMDEQEPAQRKPLRVHERVPRFA